MPTLERAHDIDAPARAAWEVLVDVSALPEMSPSTVSVDVDGPLAAPGQEFHQTVRLAGRRWTTRWVVVELVPEERLVIDGSLAPGVAYRLVEQLDGRDAQRCALSIAGTYEMPLGMLGRVASRLGVERRVHDELGSVLAAVAAKAEHEWHASSR